MGFRQRAAAVAVFTICLVGERLARAEPIAVAAQGFYESPQLFAPALYVVSPSDDGRLRFSQVGWTARFEGERFQTAHWSLLGAVELTPLRAQSSNLFYENGREDDSRDFRDTALSGNWGVAWRATHFRSELRYVVLKHWLDGLPESTASMWRSPYTGADFEVSYENLLSSDVYRSRARGLQASARAQALLGRTPFALAEAWFNYGTRLGPLFLLGGARGVYVTEQNLVSRWLLGGSFDAQGAQALFGHPFAEYRVTRAVTGLIRLDLEATRVLSFGLRGAAAAMSEGNHHGEAAVVTLDWQSLVLSAGLGVPDLKSARWHAFATVMVATFL